MILPVFERIHLAAKLNPSSLIIKDQHTKDRVGKSGPIGLTRAKLKQKLIFMPFQIRKIVIEILNGRPVVIFIYRSIIIVRYKVNTPNLFFLKKDIYPTCGWIRRISGKPMRHC